MMNEEVINAITSEIDGAFSSEKAVDIGMLTIKSANQTVEDASHRPDPEQLYLELWYEGEVCCLFADSNLSLSKPSRVKDFTTRTLETFS